MHFYYIIIIYVHFLRYSSINVYRRFIFEINSVLLNFLLKIIVKSASMVSAKTAQLFSSVIVRTNVICHISILESFLKFHVH